LFRRYCGWALLWACENGKKETAQLALTYYRDIKEEDLHRMLEIKKAFLIACEGGYVDLVKIMVNKGVLAMYMETIGTHALLLAAGEGHNSIVRVLLEGGIDPNSAKARGLTPLKAAACEGHQQTVKILLDYGAAIDCVTAIMAQLLVWLLNVGSWIWSDFSCITAQTSILLTMILG
jgi:hypothetical protein